MDLLITHTLPASPKNKQTKTKAKKQKQFPILKLTMENLLNDKSDEQGRRQGRGWMALNTKFSSDILGSQS